MLLPFFYHRRPACKHATCMVERQANLPQCHFATAIGSRALFPLVRSRGSIRPRVVESSMPVRRQRLRRSRPLLSQTGLRDASRHSCPRNATLTRPGGAWDAPAVDQEPEAPAHARALARHWGPPRMQAPAPTTTGLARHTRPATAGGATGNPLAGRLLPPRPRPIREGECRHRHGRVRRFRACSDGRYHSQ